MASVRPTSSPAGADIVGERVASYSQPVRLKWTRRPSHAAADSPREPATLVLRVDGGGALELQHMAATVIERINTSLGWRCVGKLALRQAPLERRDEPRPKPPVPDATLLAAVGEETRDIADEALRAALIRLGAHVRHRR